MNHGFATAPAVWVSLLTLLLGTGSFVAGLHLGRGSRDELRAERAAALAALSHTESEPTLESPPSCAVSIDREVLRAELSRALSNTPQTAAAEGLAGKLTQPPSTVKPEEPRLPPTSEQSAALDQARAVVDEVVTRGTMTHSQALTMRALIGNMDANARHELTTRIVVGLNQHEFALEDHELPF